MTSSKATWLEYEWLITKIYHDKGLPADFYLHNQKIKGKLSGSLRQIDCAVINPSNISIMMVLECKKYERPVSIEMVEAFNAKLEDLGNPFGILVSSSGFTKGAKNRVKTKNNIRLDKVKWEDAYMQAAEQIMPDYATQICPGCNEESDVGKAVPDFLIWEGPFTKMEKIANIFWIGSCLKCKTAMLYCEACGETTVIKSKESICKECGKTYI